MEAPVIDTKLGKLRGKVAADYLGGKYYSFQGIPYAKAPVGELRFKAPEPIGPWKEELDATQEGPECPSTHLMFQNYLGKEDNCLNLCVYIKEMPKQQSELKPVMVWIHGGAFTQGSNKTEFFGPDFLMTEDVIQVMINYRLGVFGFLCLEDESLGVTGNAGLKDQVLALKWVKENIASFGGDPNNITIYGESAGAASVHYLVVSPVTKGLFNKAIMQSGCSINPWAEGTRGAAHITKQLGIKETDEKKILEQLQKACPKKLANAQMKAPELFVPSKRRIYAPVVETPNPSAFLTEHPTKILKSGNYNKTPIMVGFLSNEGMLYELAKKLRNLKGPLDYELEIPYELEITPKSEISLNIAERIKKFYKCEEGSSEARIENVHKLKSDHHFVHGIHRTVSYNLESNNNPIYYYLFSFEGEFNYYKKFATSRSIVLYFIAQYLLSSFDRETIKNLFAKMGNGIGFNKLPGCCHADDLGYIFKSFFSQKVDPDSREAKTLKRMIRLWTNFAKFGDPTPNNQDTLLGVTWKPVEKGEHHFLNISDDLTMGVNPFEDRIHFWDSIFKEYSKN